MWNRIADRTYFFDTALLCSILKSASGDWNCHNLFLSSFHSNIMSTLLAAQLSQIAANSHNSLNLKAQKAAHSKSLIFEARVAASQSFDTLYTLCHEGFQELCLLDGRFLEFQRDIFSEQSQEQDRTQMNAQQNSDLDRRIESFLGLVGARLRLNPAIKAVEWLIRRFR